MPTCGGIGENIRVLVSVAIACVMTCRAVSPSLPRHARLEGGEVSWAFSGSAREQRSRGVQRVAVSLRGVQRITVAERLSWFSYRWETLVFISVRDLEKIKSIHLYKNAWGSGKCSLYGRKFSVSLFAVYVCINCGVRVVGEHSLRTSVTVFGLIAKDRKD